VTAPTASKSIVVDSSGWLEYITKDTKAELFRPYFSGEYSLIIPSLVLYEVRKVLLLRSTAAIDEWFASEAMRHQIVDLDKETAFEAAALSASSHLHMADAIIYTAARRNSAQLVTADSHFSTLAGVLSL